MEIRYVVCYDSSMPTVKKTIVSKRISAKFVIGKKRFSAISAVEGIRLTTEMKKRAADFDKKGLSAEERRRAIIKVYRKG